MRNFLILFKHEMKMQFPRKSKKEKLDISGMALSLLATLLVAVVFIVLVSTIVQNYVLVEINKVPAPMQRGKELLNFFYVVILLTIAFTCMEKMRSTLTQKKDKELFLRLPVKPQTLFMSKLCTLLVWTYIFAFVLIIAVNIIFFIVLKPSFLFWLYTLLAWLLMPMAAFLLATVLLVPYIKLIDFRTIDSVALIEPSRNLIDTISEMEAVQEWMATYRQDVGFEKCTFFGLTSNSNNPDEIARSIRTYLEVPVRWYEETDTARGSFAYWREKINQAGVIVMMNGVVKNNTRRP